MLLKVPDKVEFPVPTSHSIFEVESYWLLLNLALHLVVIVPKLILDDTMALDLFRSNCFW